MKPTRVYTAPEVTVEWYPELCVHCQNCINELPSVFNLTPPLHTPWINLDGASAERVKAQVRNCPSGALKLG